MSSGASVLDGGGKATRNARLIAREIVKEAQSSHETLVAFSVGGPDAESEPADIEADCGSRNPLPASMDGYA